VCETAVAAAGCVKLRIEIKNPLCLLIDQPQIGIARAHDAVLLRAREIATESRHGVEQLPCFVFKMAAHFVNARDALDDAVGRVQLRDDFIKHAADQFDDAPGSVLI
jgi:hypothetical protein